MTTAAERETREKEIRERLAKATPGPWVHASKVGLACIAACGETDDGEKHFVRPAQSDAVEDGARYDAEFIAHSRSDMEHLLSELDRVRVELEEAKRDSDRLDHIESHGLPDEKVYDGHSLREAIDAAMQP